MHTNMLVEMSEEKRVRSMWEKDAKCMYLNSKCFKVQSVCSWLRVGFSGRLSGRW